MGTPITVTCRQLTFPTPPSIDIPHFGILQKAQETLDGIPDPADLLCKFQDTIAVALAPVRRYLEMIEAFLTIKQCMSVIPDAITSLDPGVILDCMKNLAKAFARLLSWLPPFTYVRLAMDVTSYLLDLVDAILSLAARVDDKIDKWVNLDALAKQLGDLELVNFVNCGMEDLSTDLRLLLKLVKFIEPANDVLMEMFLRLLNSDGLRDAYEKYKEASEYYDKVDTALSEGASSLPALAGFSSSDTQDPVVPVPRMGALWENMNRSRNAAVVIYNTLAPFVGADADKEARSLPTFKYL